MFGLIKFVKSKRKNRKIKSDEIKLINQIHTTVTQIAQTESWFQIESDENLINSCIYQRELLYSKYKYLINKAKFNNIKIQPKYLIKFAKENQ